MEYSTVSLSYIYHTHVIYMSGRLLYDGHAACDPSFVYCLQHCIVWNIVLFDGHVAYDPSFVYCMVDTSLTIHLCILYCMMDTSLRSILCILYFMVDTSLTIPIVPTCAWYVATILWLLYCIVVEWPHTRQCIYICTRFTSFIYCYSLSARRLTWNKPKWLKITKAKNYTN